MKRLLITGATGFIGAHCLRAVVERGGYNEIHAVGRSNNVDESLAVWHRADLRATSEAIRVISEVRPTHLFHLAWIATPGVYLSSPENIDWMVASIALVRAFAEHGGQNFLGVGSSAEYAPSEDPSEEDLTLLQPASIYGKCKVATWCATQALAQHYNFQAKWARLFLPYGPGDPASRLIPMAISALRAGQSLKLSHGEQLRDFVYAPDAADLLVRLLDAESGGAFNIGSGEPRSVRSVLEAIADRFGARKCLRFGELPLREGEPNVLVADMKKFNKHVGVGTFTPMATAIDGLIRSAIVSSDRKTTAP